jgi:hypothetical protein
MAYYSYSIDEEIERWIARRRSSRLEISLLEQGEEPQKE